MGITATVTCVAIVVMYVAARVREANMRLMTVGHPGITYQ